MFRYQKSENKLAKGTEKERTVRKEENQQSMLFWKPSEERFLRREQSSISNVNDSSGNMGTENRSVDLPTSRSV